MNKAEVLAKQEKAKKEKYIQKINERQRKKARRICERAAKDPVKVEERPPFTTATSSEEIMPPAMQVMSGTSLQEFVYEDLEKEIFEFEQKLKSHSKNPVADDDFVLKLLQETVAETIQEQEAVVDEVRVAPEESLGAHAYHTQQMEVYEEDSDTTDVDDDSEASFEIEYQILEGSNGVDYVLKHKNKSRNPPVQISDILVSPVVDSMRERKLSKSLLGLQSEIEKSKDTVKRTLHTSDARAYYMDDDYCSDQRLEKVQDLTQLQLQLEYLNYLNKKTIPWFADMFSSSDGSPVTKNPLNIFLKEKLHIKSTPEISSIKDEVEKEDPFIPQKAVEVIQEEKQVQTNNVKFVEPDSLISFWNEWADDQQKQTERRLDAITKKWEEDLGKSLPINALLGKFLDSSFEKDEAEEEAICEDKGVGTEGDLASIFVQQRSGHDIQVVDKQTQENLVGTESCLHKVPLEPKLSLMKQPDVAIQENKTLPSQIKRPKSIEEEEITIEEETVTRIAEEPIIPDKDFILNGKLHIDEWKNKLESDEYLKSLAKSSEDMRELAIDLIETTDTLYKRKMEEEKLKQNAELASSILRQALRLQPALLRTGEDPEQTEMKQQAREMLNQLKQIEKQKPLSPISTVQSDLTYEYSETFATSESEFTTNDVTISEVPITLSPDTTSVTLTEFDNNSIANYSDVTLSLSSHAPPSDVTVEISPSSKATEPNSNVASSKPDVVNSPSKKSDASSEISLSMSSDSPEKAESEVSEKERPRSRSIENIPAEVESFEEYSEPEEYDEDSTRSSSIISIESDLADDVTKASKFERKKTYFSNN